MKIDDILSRDESVCLVMVKGLPFPGFVEWFLASFLDELDESDSTMDVLSPKLSKFYDNNK